MTITAYPLSWPAGWKRTDEAYRLNGKFGVRRTSGSSSYKTLQDITVYGAAERLLRELGMMDVSRDTIIISTNLKTRQDGLPRSDQGNPRDPGAAVYWNDPHTDAPRVMAIDQYTTVADNIAALAATIEAMRAIKRHGGAVVLEKAFTGFLALPPPIAAGMTRPWHEVLGVEPTASRAEVEKAYRLLKSLHHPDRPGGSHSRMAELNVARDTAMKVLP